MNQLDLEMSRRVLRNLGIKGTDAELDSLSKTLLKLKAKKKRRQGRKPS